MSKNGQDSLALLNQVLENTVEAVERSKTVIFEIAENARQDMQRVKKELGEIKRETEAIIRDVDRLQHKDRLARLRLMEVSRDIHRFTRDDQRIAYEEAERVRVEMVQKQERELQIRKRRDDLEMSLRSLANTVEKGEALVTYVSAASNLLRGSTQEMVAQIEGLQAKQHLGVKVIMAQEEERKRVARDIHDGPAQSMANVVLRAEFCERLMDSDIEKARVELKELKDVVRNCLGDIRRIIFDLRPMTLDDLGLIPTLRRYINDYKDKHGIETELQIFGREQRLPPPVELALFRTVQEALNNVTKHADARCVWVKAEITSQQAVIVVRDDGRGFDLTNVQLGKARNSLGLISMRERIELISGRFHIDTAPGRGTRLVISVPLEDFKGVADGDKTTTS